MPVHLLSSSQLRLFLGSHPTQGRLGDLELVDDRAVEHEYAARSDRSHRQFLVPWQAQLAHDEDVQGHAETGGDLVGDRNPTARNGQHDYVTPARILLERGGEHAPGMSAILVAAHFHAGAENQD